MTVPLTVSLNRVLYGVFDDGACCVFDHVFEDVFDRVSSRVFNRIHIDAK